MNLHAIAMHPGPARHVVRLAEGHLSSGPRLGYARVRSIGAPINPSDLITIAGTYSRTTFPFRPGFEGAAEVLEVANDSALRPGDQVVPIRGAGSWSTLRDVPMQHCLKLRPGLSAEQAATSYINPMTALLAMEAVAASDRPIVITAASSVIAGQLAALLDRAGIPAIGILRSTHSIVTHPENWTCLISSEEPGWQEQLRATAAHASTVLDAVGGPHAIEVVNCLRTREPELVSYGLLSGVPIPVKDLPAGTQLKNLHLRPYAYATPLADIQYRFDQAQELIRSDILSCAIAARFALTDLNTALEQAEQMSGKILLLPPRSPTGTTGHES